MGWPLYKKYGHCYDAFKLVLTDQEDVFAGLEPAVAPDLKDTLSDYIKKRLAPQPIKVRRGAASGGGGCLAAGGGARVLTVL